jgi:metal-responsive CopG/Arc/MetJ family transcriptional regulator
MKDESKIRTSVTLPRELLSEVDDLLGERNKRSEFIEKALRAYVAELAERRRAARDVGIINANAGRVNREALETLEYQVDW